MILPYQTSSSQEIAENKYTINAIGHTKKSAAFEMS